MGRRMLSDHHMQTRELLHPLRSNIYRLYKKTPSRSLEVGDLLRDLPPIPGGEIRAAQVKYHLRRLRLVGLVPY